MSTSTRGGGFMRRLAGGAVVLTALASPAHAQQAAGQQAAPAPEVRLPGTETLAIHSAVTGQDYVLYVSLPRGYASGKGTFPVIYSVDGQWDFTLVQALYGQQNYDGFVPDAIVVGITWGGEKPDYDVRRAFDLTPTPLGQPKRFGNAAKFLEFIRTEAIPFVEGRYRTTKDERTLTGSSFGGLFTLFALFHQPGLFNQYVLTSPSWHWDNRVLFTYGEQFARSPLPRPARVFMAVGEHEDVAGFEKLASAMRGYKLAGLELETRVITNGGHSGSKAEGFSRGLQFVFARPCAALSAEALQRLAGEYDVAGGGSPLTVRFAVENGSLAAYHPSGSKAVLCADTERDFHVVGQFLRIHFVQEPDKTISGFRLEQYSGEIQATRRR